MTRVLHLLETGGPGGAERMILDLAQNLGQSWHPVIGVAKRGWLHAQATAAGMRCVMIGGGAFADVGVLQRLLNTVHIHDVAVIHAHEFYMSVMGVVASMLTRRPLVVTLHGKSYYPDKARRRFACRLVAARAARVVTVSTDLRAFFCRTTRVPPERVRVIHNGIDLAHAREPHRRGQLLESVGIPVDAQIIGAVGNLYPVKGHLDLVRAVPAIVRQRPAAHVVILGRGSLHDALMAEATALGIRNRIHLLGHREDVRDWLGAMDVFTLPSLSEGLPMALLEAMAAGLPAVVSDVGGMPEVVVDDETGFIVPRADVAALAERISIVLADPLVATRMGAASRERIRRRFTVDRMGAAYGDVYRDALQRSAA